MSPYGRIHNLIIKCGYAIEIKWHPINKWWHLYARPANMEFCVAEGRGQTLEDATSHLEQKIAALEVAK